jgi:hypothetical protein
MRDSEKKRLTRREFGMAAATAAGLSLLPGVGLAMAANQKPAAGIPETKPSPPTPEPPSQEAQALAGIVKLRYGSRLDDAAMQDITRSLDGSLKTVAALRKLPLENSDEPAFLFHAWRGEHD